MSYRILPKLNLIAPIVLILDNVAQSVVNVRNSEDRFNERLVDIQIELNSLKDRLEQKKDEDFFEKYQKDSVQQQIQNIDEEQGTGSQTIEELTIIFEEVQNVIDGTVENADEGVYLRKRIVELKLEQKKIEELILPQIERYKDIAKNKTGVAERLLTSLQPIPPLIDGILDTIDIKIAEILVIPIIGPPVGKVLELVVDLIDYAILQPLILALELGISLLNSINQIYTFEE